MRHVNSLCRRERSDRRQRETRELGGGGIPQRAVRPLFVVFSPPVLDDNPSLEYAREHLPVQAFVPEFPVEALDVGVLSGTPRLNVDRPNAVSSHPPLYLHGDELGAVVAANVPGRSMPRNEASQLAYDFFRPKNTGPRG